jgi:hypothetical protein
MNLLVTEHPAVAVTLVVARCWTLGAHSMFVLRGISFSF